MKIRVGICVLLLAFTAMSGCKNKQQKAEDLNAEYQAADTKYKKDCYDPSQMVSGGGTAEVLRGGMTGAETQALHEQEQATARRIASAQCKAEAARRDEIGAKLFAAVNQSQ